MKSCALPGLKLSFDAVFYYVADLERSVTFYRNTLDLPLVSRDVVARFDVDGVLFELVPTPPAHLITGSGNARLCFEVQDIQGSVAQLRQRAVRVTEVRAVHGGLLASFYDPDGNELCLWQYTQPGSHKNS